MRELIQSKLDEIERAKHVKILYACESGSRAWGFESEDSDYDVRFFYVHTSEWYLSIGDKRDVIEDVGQILDFNGWELRKMLKLLKGSNTSVFEKLQSPVVYKEMNGFRDELWAISEDYFNPIGGIYSYISLVKSFYKDELSSKQVKLKKYFYVLRSLLAAKWIMQKQTVPPMEFAILRTLELGTEWNELIDQLLCEKSKVNEFYRIPRNRFLSEYVESEMATLDAYVRRLRAKPSGSIEPLDKFFRKWI